MTAVLEVSQMTQVYQADTPVSFETGDEFGDGYSLGYGTGYDIGWLHGRDEERSSWNAIIGVYRETMKRPRAADLEQARKHTNDPCAFRCKRCSRCTRYETAFRNQRIYGQPDYPGGPVPAW